MFGRLTQHWKNIWKPRRLSFGDRQARSFRPSVDELECRLNPSWVAVNDAFSVHHGGQVSMNVLANDNAPGAMPASVMLVTQPAHGNVTMNPTGLQYSSTEGYVGTDTFTYKLMEMPGPGFSNIATVTISVTNVSTVAVNDSASVHHGGQVTMNLLANDTNSDGDITTVQIVSNPAHGSVAQVGTQWRYTSTEGFVGTDSFTYKVFDGAEFSNVATASVNVTNTATVAVNDSLSVNKNTAGTVNVLANDSNTDGDILTTTITQAPAHGTATLNGTQYQYTPTAGYFGPDSFSYKVFDGAEYSNVASVAVQVTIPPTIALSSATVAGNQVTVTGTVTDDAPGGLTVTLGGVVSGTTTTASNGSFTYTGTLSGPGTITAVTTDGQGQVSNTATINVVNGAPSLTLSITTVYRDQVTVTGQVTDEDPGGLTVTFSGQLTGSAVTGPSGAFSFTGTASGVGTISASTTDPLGQASPAATVNLTSNVPVIQNFQAVNQMSDNYWLFEGQVVDENAPGLTVNLGGLTSLAGVNVTVHADGWFSVTLQLGAGETGWASAIVTDWLHQASEQVFAFV